MDSEKLGDFFYFPDTYHHAILNTGKLTVGVTFEAMREQEWEEDDDQEL